jgi:hypothetical protein
MLQDTFCCNGPKIDVATEVLIGNSFITNQFVSSFRKTTSKYFATCVHFAPWLLFQITTKLSVVTFSRTLLHAPRCKILQLVFNADSFEECPLAACHLKF